MVWAALISILSSSWFTGEQTGEVLLPLFAVIFPRASVQELEAIHQGVRKMAHFTEYLVLSVLIYRALREGRGWSLRTALAAVVFAGLYAIGDEFHQWFVPGRTAAASDCLIDVWGAAAGQGIVAAHQRSRQPEPEGLTPPAGRRSA